MTKKTFFLIYGVFSLLLFAFSAYNYFSVDKNLWWFASMLSGVISSGYSYLLLKREWEEESFMNYIVNIFLATSFFISYGLAAYQGADENLPIILCGINFVLWLSYSLFLHKRLKKT